VYPAITQEELVKMSVNQIMSYDIRKFYCKSYSAAFDVGLLEISRILGATKNITARDSKAFAKEIAKYIDSKDQKRGKKDKDAKKDKPKEPSLMDQIRRNVVATSIRAPAAPAQNDADAPALWPLIRQVNVRCNAKALSTGAVLVDLPGN